jgi:hypothetical protein
LVHRLAKVATRGAWSEAGGVAAGGGVGRVDRGEGSVDHRLRADGVQGLYEGLRDKDVVDEFLFVSLPPAVGRAID